MQIKNVNLRLVKALDDARLARHAVETDKILKHYRLFCPPGTIPTANLTSYESHRRQLHRNWLADSEQKIAFGKAMQGYASADDYKRMHHQSPSTKLDTSAKSMSQTAKRFNFADFNLREEIEKFSVKIELRRKRSEAPAVKKESEIVTRGKEIAKELNLSPRSCCPRLFNALNTDDVPETKHNKPLSHMVRSVQLMLQQFHVNTVQL